MAVELFLAKKANSLIVERLPISPCSKMIEALQNFELVLYVYYSASLYYSPIRNGCANIGAASLRLLDLGIALSGVSANTRPCSFFSPAEDALKRPMT